MKKRFVLGYPSGYGKENEKMSSLRATCESRIVERMKCEGYKEGETFIKERHSPCASLRESLVSGKCYSKYTLPKLPCEKRTEELLACIYTALLCMHACECSSFAYKKSAPRTKSLDKRKSRLSTSELKINSRLAVYCINYNSVSEFETPITHERSETKPRTRLLPRVPILAGPA